MVFGWLNPKKEPKNSHLVEFSNDDGDHVVVDVPTARDARSIEKIADEHGLERDTDDTLIQRVGRTRAERIVETRDPNQVRYHSGKVVNPNEDLEPEEDDDSTFDGDRDEDKEPDEVVADGPWDGSSWPGDSKKRKR